VLVEAEEVVEEPAAEQLVEEAEEAIEEVEEAPVETYSVQHIPTETQPVIYNSRTKKSYTLHEAIARILNIAEGEQ